MHESTAEYFAKLPAKTDPIDSRRMAVDWSREKIRESWERCFGSGLDRFQVPKPIETSSQELRELRERDSFLLNLVRSELPKLQRQLPGDSCLLGFANRDAILVEVACANPSVLSASRAIPGSCWQERLRGTNAIGTAAYTRGPVAVCMQEHFLQEYWAINCIATPLHEPDGEFLGTIHVSSACPIRQQHSMAMLRMAAAHVESELFKQRHRSAIVLQFHSREEFAGTLDAGLIALDEEGQVISSTLQAQFLLEGVRLQPGCHFDEIFRTGFWQLMSRRPGGSEAIQLTDVKGSSSSVRVHLPEGGGKPWSLPASGRTPEEAGEISPGFICSDPAVARAVSLARRAAAMSVPILIRGETGTGKEMLAQAIHRMSGRTGPFVAVNCAAMPESLIEAELFGYREGAFTGARNGGAEGLILQANRGTLFLDEIGDMPVNLQPALLRFLDSWTVRPIGSHKELKVNVQLVTATNCDLEGAVAERRFRRDLLHRINALEVVLPPLHARSDFDEIVASTLAELSPHLRITEGALHLLRQQPMPGNVRELRNILLRAALDCDGPECSAAVIHSLLNKPEMRGADPVEGGSPLLDMRRNMILDAYRNSQGNISKVAQILRVSRNTVYRELRQSGLIESGTKSPEPHRVLQ